MTSIDLYWQLAGIATTLIELISSSTTNDPRPTPAAPAAFIQGGLELKQTVHFYTHKCDE